MGTLVPWLQEGLERGDGALVATAAPHIERFRDSLGSDEGSVSYFFADDRHVHPSQTIAAWQRLLVEAAAKGADHTRIVGEVRFGATPDLQTSWTRYESALNAVFEHSPTWIVCPYDVRVLPPDVVDKASRTHPTVWDPTRHKSDRYEPPARLLSEILEPGRAVTGPPSLDIPIDERLSEMRASGPGAAEPAFPRAGWRSSSWR